MFSQEYSFLFFFSLCCCLPCCIYVCCIYFYFSFSTLRRIKLITVSPVVSVKVRFVRTHTHTHTHSGPIALPGPLAWLVPVAACVTGSHEQRRQRLSNIGGYEYGLTRNNNVTDALIPTSRHSLKVRSGCRHRSCKIRTIT